MFLTRKDAGRIKGTCTQMVGNNDETTSEVQLPVSGEAVMLSAVIDAMEDDDVATVDIPGGGIHAGGYRRSRTHQVEGRDAE
jgi:hypothetical protein